MSHAYLSYYNRDENLTFIYQAVIEINVLFLIKRIYSLNHEILLILVIYSPWAHGFAAYSAKHLSFDAHVAHNNHNKRRKEYDD